MAMDAIGTTTEGLPKADSVPNGGKANPIMASAFGKAGGKAITASANKILNPLNTIKDAQETRRDFSQGNNLRGVAGVIDTSMNFAGKTGWTFAGSVAWDMAGGARGVVDAMPTGPIDATFQISLALHGPPSY